MFNCRKTVLAAMIFAGASGSVYAKAFTVEGKLSQMNIDPATLSVAGSGNHVVCNGTKVYLKPSTTFTTPTGAITVDKLILATPFPGVKPAMADAPSAPNSQPSAFIGGTCIIDGDDSEVEGGRLADNVFVEIGENVLVGPTTSVKGAPFEIMGVKILLLAQKPADGSTMPAGYVEEPGGRVIAVPVTNATGMKVNINSIPLGDESSAEGYMGFAEDGSKVFYSHAIETTAGDPAEPQTYAMASIQRADMTSANATTVKLDIRGGCTYTDSVTTTSPIVLQVDRGSGWINATGQNNLNTTTTCTKDPVTGQGTYRYRNDNFRVTTSTDPALNTVPKQVRAFVGPAPTDGSLPHYSETVPLNRIGFK